MIEWLTTPLWVLASYTMTRLEAITTVLALIGIWLNTKQSIWAWPVNIAAILLSMALFAVNRIYGDMALQIYFLLASLYGWYAWLHGTQVEDSMLQARPLTVSYLSKSQWLLLLILWAGLWAVLYQVLKHHTNTDVPGLDAMTTAGSIIAQVLLARKKIENWLLWFVVDAVYIGLYLIKSLWLTAGLYGIFLLLCVLGWQRWRADQQARSTMVPA